MKIRTIQWPKDGLLPDFNWTACAELYDYGDPIGMGRTEDEAVKDLERQLTEIGHANE
jgi:hypothetical protein